MTEFDRGEPFFYKDPRIQVFEEISNQYELSMLSVPQLLKSNDLTVVQNMYWKFLYDATLPKQSQICAENGTLEEGIKSGVSMFCSKEVVLGRLVSIASILMNKFNESVSLPITEDIPMTTVKIRQMFPSEFDEEIVRSCQVGIIDGWERLLELLQIDEAPLHLYSKKLEPFLEERSKQFGFNSEGIIFPTAIEGLNVKYQYSNDFPLPYVSAVISP